MVTGLIAAAGNGSRMGGSENKVYLKLFDRAIIQYTVDAFLECELIDEIVIATGECDLERCKEIFKNTAKPVKVIAGGNTRQESVYNGIKEAKGDIIAIHDGARALIKTDEIKNAVLLSQKYGASAVGVPVKDTIKIIDDDGFIKETTKREYTYQIQTPQVFKRDIIKKAHEQYKDVSATDDCMLAELMGVKIKIAQGSYENIKITTPEDLVIAKAIIRKRKDSEQNG